MYCIFFTVKCKNDAHIVMASNFGIAETKSYSIVIGGKGNTETYIRTGIAGSNM